MDLCISYDVLSWAAIVSVLVLGFSQLHFVAGYSELRDEGQEVVVAHIQRHSRRKWFAAWLLVIVDSPSDSSKKRGWDVSRLS